MTGAPTLKRGFPPPPRLQVVWQAARRMAGLGGDLPNPYDPTRMGTIYPGQNMNQLKRVMIFVDGTNLLFRLAAEKLSVSRLSYLFTQYHLAHRGREIARIYFYTVQQKVDEAEKIHGKDFLEGIRTVLGDGIQTPGGVKEKAVDALLVADLIYHAASRNCDEAILISHDTDFVYAIKRVEDFGCTTAVGGICSAVPERLKNSCDRVFEIPTGWIVNQNFGRRLP